MSGLYNLYLPLLLTFLVGAAVAFGMWAGGAFVGKKNPTPEKLMPYECGNDTSGAEGIKMHVKFYLTAILFVIFDIEAVFLYPWAVLFKGLGWNGFLTMAGFIAALVVALVYCWKKGALEWEN